MKKGKYFPPREGSLKFGQVLGEQSRFQSANHYLCFFRHISLPYILTTEPYVEHDVYGEGKIKNVYYMREQPKSLMGQS